MKKPRVVEGQVCWFCKQPADSTSWRGLGELLSTTHVRINDLPILYHEPCAVYSNGSGAIPNGGMPEEEVRRWFEHGESICGQGLKCLLCGKRGATLGCCQSSCNKVYHFTCARILAFKDDIRFALYERAVACKNHAKKLPGAAEEEFTGMWMEGSGGWAGAYYAEAMGEWLPHAAQKRLEFVEKWVTPCFASKAQKTKKGKKGGRTTPKGAQASKSSRGGRELSDLESHQLPCGVHSAASTQLQDADRAAAVGQLPAGGQVAASSNARAAGTLPVPPSRKSTRQQKEEAVPEKPATTRMQTAHQGPSVLQQSKQKREGKHQDTEGASGGIAQPGGESKAPLAQKRSPRGREAPAGRGEGDVQAQKSLETSLPKLTRSKEQPSGQPDNAVRQATRHTLEAPDHVPGLSSRKALDHGKELQRGPTSKSEGLQRGPATKSGAPSGAPAKAQATAEAIKTGAQSKAQAVGEASKGKIGGMKLSIRLPSPQRPAAALKSRSMSPISRSPRQRGPSPVRESQPAAEARPAAGKADSAGAPPARSSGAAPAVVGTEAASVTNAEGGAGGSSAVRRPRNPLEAEPRASQKYRSVLALVTGAPDVVSRRGGPVIVVTMAFDSAPPSPSLYQEDSAAAATPPGPETSEVKGEAAAVESAECVAGPTSASIPKAAAQEKAVSGILSGVGPLAEGPSKPSSSAAAAPVDAGDSGVEAEVAGGASPQAGLKRARTKPLTQPLDPVLGKRSGPDAAPKRSVPAISTKPVNRASSAQRNLIYSDSDSETERKRTSGAGSAVVAPNPPDTGLAKRKTAPSPQKEGDQLEANRGGPASQPGKAAADTGKVTGVAVSGVTAATDNPIGQEPHGDAATEARKRPRLDSASVVKEPLTSPLVAAHPCARSKESSPLSLPTEPSLDPQGAVAGPAASGIVTSPPRLSLTGSVPFEQLSKSRREVMLMRSKAARMPPRVVGAETLVAAAVPPVQAGDAEGAGPASSVAQPLLSPRGDGRTSGQDGAMESRLGPQQGTAEPQRMAKGEKAGSHDGAAALRPGSQQGPVGPQQFEKGDKAGSHDGAAALRPGSQQGPVEPPRAVKGDKAGSHDGAAGLRPGSKHGPDESQRTAKGERAGSHDGAAALRPGPHQGRVEPAHLAKGEKAGSHGCAAIVRPGSQQGLAEPQRVAKGEKTGSRDGAAALRPNTQQGRVEPQRPEERERAVGRDGAAAPRPGPRQGPVDPQRLAKGGKAGSQLGPAESQRTAKGENAGGTAALRPGSQHGLAGPQRVEKGEKAGGRDGVAALRPGSQQGPGAFQRLEKGEKAGGHDGVVTLRPSSQHGRVEPQRAPKGERNAGNDGALALRLGSQQGPVEPQRLAKGERAANHEGAAVLRPGAQQGRVDPQRLAKGDKAGSHDCAAASRPGSRQGSAEPQRLAKADSGVRVQGKRLSASQMDVSGDDFDEPLLSPRLKPPRSMSSIAESFAQRAPIAALRSSGSLPAADALAAPHPPAPASEAREAGSACSREHAKQVAEPSPAAPGSFASPSRSPKAGAKAFQEVDLALDKGKAVQADGQDVVEKEEIAPEVVAAEQRIANKADGTTAVSANEAAAPLGPEDEGVACSGDDAAGAAARDLTSALGTNGTPFAFPESSIREADKPAVRGRKQQRYMRIGPSRSPSPIGDSDAEPASQPSSPPSSSSSESWESGGLGRESPPKHRRDKGSARPSRPKDKDKGKDGSAPAWRSNPAMAKRLRDIGITRTSSNKRLDGSPVPGTGAGVRKTMTLGEPETVLRRTASAATEVGQASSAPVRSISPPSSPPAKRPRLLPVTGRSSAPGAVEEHSKTADTFSCILEAAEVLEAGEALASAALAEEVAHEVETNLDQAGTSQGGGVPAAHPSNKPGSFSLWLKSSPAVGQVGRPEPPPKVLVPEPAAGTGMEPKEAPMPGLTKEVGTGEPESSDDKEAAAEANAAATAAAEAVVAAAEAVAKRLRTHQGAGANPPDMAARSFAPGQGLHAGAVHGLDRGRPAARNGILHPQGLSWTMEDPMPSGRGACLLAAAQMAKSATNVGGRTTGEGHGGSADLDGWLPPPDPEPGADQRKRRFTSRPIKYMDSPDAPVAATAAVAAAAATAAKPGRQGRGRGRAPGTQRAHQRDSNATALALASAAAVAALARTKSSKRLGKSRLSPSPFSAQASGDWAEDGHQDEGAGGGRRSSLASDASLMEQAEALLVLKSMAPRPESGPEPEPELKPEVEPEVEPEPQPEPQPGPIRNSFVDGPDRLMAPPEDLSGISAALYVQLVKHRGELERMQVKDRVMLPGDPQASSSTGGGSESGSMEQPGTARHGDLTAWHVLPMGGLALYKNSVTLSGGLTLKQLPKPRRSRLGKGQGRGFGDRGELLLGEEDDEETEDEDDEGEDEAEGGLEEEGDVGEHYNEAERGLQHPRVRVPPRRLMHNSRLYVYTREAGQRQRMRAFLTALRKAVRMPRTTRYLPPLTSPGGPLPRPVEPTNFPRPSNALQPKTMAAAASVPAHAGGSHGLHRPGPSHRRLDGVREGDGGLNGRESSPEGIELPWSQPRRGQRPDGSVLAPPGGHVLAQSPPALLARQPSGQARPSQQGGARGPPPVPSRGPSLQQSGPRAQAAPMRPPAAGMVSPRGVYYMPHPGMTSPPGPGMPHFVMTSEGQQCLVMPTSAGMQMFPSGPFTFGPDGQLHAMPGFGPFPHVSNSPVGQERQAAPDGRASQPFSPPPHVARRATGPATPSAGAKDSATAQLPPLQRRYSGSAPPPPPGLFAPAESLFMSSAEAFFSMGRPPVVPLPMPAPVPSGGRPSSVARAPGSSNGHSGGAPAGDAAAASTPKPQGGHKEQDINRQLQDHLLKMQKKVERRAHMRREQGQQQQQQEGLLEQHSHGQQEPRQQQQQAQVQAAGQMDAVHRGSFSRDGVVADHSGHQAEEGGATQPPAKRARLSSGTDDTCIGVPPPGGGPAVLEQQRSGRPGLGPLVADAARDTRQVTSPPLGPGSSSEFGAPHCSPSLPRSSSLATANGTAPMQQGLVSQDGGVGSALGAPILQEGTIRSASPLSSPRVMVLPQTADLSPLPVAGHSALPGATQQGASSGPPPLQVGVPGWLQCQVQDGGLGVASAPPLQGPGPAPQRPPPLSPRAPAPASAPRAEPLPTAAAGGGRGRQDGRRSTQARAPAGQAGQAGPGSQQAASPGMQPFTARRTSNGQFVLVPMSGHSGEMGMGAPHGMPVPMGYGQMPQMHFAAMPQMFAAPGPLPGHAGNPQRVMAGPMGGFMPMYGQHLGGMFGFPGQLMPAGPWGVPGSGQPMSIRPGVPRPDMYLTGDSDASDSPASVSDISM